MSTVLYAWELGADYGHVSSFLPVAQQLRAQGHRVVLAVKDLSRIQGLAGARDFEIVQAPVWLYEVKGLAEPMVCYTDMLHRFGYLNSTGLLGIAKAWRALFALIRPSLLIADHAPTALLAARTMATPVMLFSNGFTAPPRRSPLPNMRPWTPVPEQTLGQLDRAALSSINAVLARHDCAQMQHLAELFDVTEEALVTFPELDHYPDRGPARYWGSLPSAGAGRPVAWPAGGNKRIFAYLRAESPHHEAVLAALHALGQAAAIYFPNMPPALTARYSAAHLSYLDQPADIEQMTREADLAITYASLATTTAFLLAGKPLLMLPGHLEQFLVARRVEEMGAGRLVNPEQPADDLRGMIADLIDNPAWRTNAAAFAAKYAAFDQQAVTGNLVRRIDEMLDGPSSIKGMP